MLDDATGFLLELRHSDTGEVITRTAPAVKAQEKLSWIWSDDIVV